jgi:hypothetical protein
MSESLEHHLVYIAFFFPPSRASGVYRAIATANSFASKGWKVTVVTCDETFLAEEIGTVDKSLLTEVNNQVEIQRVPFSFRTSTEEKSIREYKWFQANFHRLFLKLQKSLASLRKPKSTELVPLSKYDNWIGPVVKKVEEIHDQNSVSHVLATGNPFASFHAANLINEAIGISYSLDYRDPWTTNVFTGEKASLPSEVFTLEQKVVEDASFTFQINEEIRQKLVDQYPSVSARHYIAPNGFDKDSVASKSSIDAPIVVGMLGTLNDNWPLKEIFEAWSRVRLDLPEGSVLRLGGYLGYFAHSEGSLIRKLPDRSEGFEYVGPVSKGEVKEFYESLNIIVIPATGGSMVTTGKVYEAAAQPHSIVCVQTREGGARKALKGRPHVYGAEPNTGEIERAFLDAINSHVRVSEKDRDGIKEFARKYERYGAIEIIYNVISSDLDKQS